MVVTVVGLVLTIPRFGIEGAAATSSVAYGVAFALSLVFLRSAIGISLRRSLSAGGRHPRPPLRARAPGCRGGGAAATAQQGQAS